MLILDLNREVTKVPGLWRVSGCLVPLFMISSGNQARFPIWRSCYWGGICASRRSKQGGSLGKGRRHVADVPLQGITKSIASESSDTGKQEAEVAEDDADCKNDFAYCTSAMNCVLTDIHTSWREDVNYLMTAEGAPVELPYTCGRARTHRSCVTGLV